MPPLSPRGRGNFGSLSPITDKINTVVLPTALAGQAPACEDLDTTACGLFLSKLPNLCSDPALSTSCQRFCGFCPIVCHDCPTAVNETGQCNDTKACAKDELCMLREHSAPGAGKEYMTCEKQSVCDGLGVGFHNLVGKRDIEESREQRDLNFHCCNTDLCNYPTDFITTTTAATITTTKMANVSLPGISATPVHGCVKDIVFLLDGSTSVGNMNHVFSKIFVEDLIGSLHIGTQYNQVAMVEYSNTARVEWYLNDHTTSRDLQQAVSNTPYVKGSTATHAGFWLIRNTVLTARHGDRSNVRDTVVVLTDGGTDVPDLATSEAKKLHSDGVDVITIGIGRDAHQTEISKFANPPTNYFHVNDYKSLINIAQLVVKKICN